MARILPGYQRVPGSARQYRTPSGDVISRRAYEDIRVRRSGFRSWAEWQGLRRDPNYQRWLDATSQRLNVPKSELRRAESDFNKRFLRAKKSKWNKKQGRQFDKFLQYVGYRTPDMGWDVGDTPNGRA